MFVMDISGVVTVDTAVANNFIRITQTPKVDPAANSQTEVRQAAASAAPATYRADATRAPGPPRMGPGTLGRRLAYASRPPSSQSRAKVRSHRSPDFVCRNYACANSKRSLPVSASIRGRY